MGGQMSSSQMSSGSAVQSTSYASQVAQQQQQAAAQQAHNSKAGVSGNSQMPSAADISLMLSLGLGLNPADASQLANLDLQKLAMYLVSIVRTIPEKWRLTFFFRQNLNLNNCGFRNWPHSWRERLLFGFLITFLINLYLLIILSFLWFLYFVGYGFILF